MSHLTFFSFTDIFFPVTKRYNLQSCKNGLQPINYPWQALTMSISSLGKAPLIHARKNQHKPFYHKHLIHNISVLILCSYAGMSQAITATADRTSVDANSEVSIAVLTNDKLDDGSSAGSSPYASVCLDPQRFSSVCTSYEISFNATSPENGTLSIDGNVVLYTPNDDFIGNDSFVYTAFYEGPNSDGYQTSDTTVIITVSEPQGPSQEEQELEEAFTNLCESASANEFDVSYEFSRSEAPNGTISSACSSYKNLTESEKTQALKTLAADQVTAEFSTTVNMTRKQSANISSRLTQLRNNSTGLNIRGLTINNYGEQLDGTWLQAAYSSLSNPSSIELNESSLSGGSAGTGSESIAYTPFGFFINGSISLGDKKSTSTERGYDIDGDNYTLGMDYRIDDRLVVGAAYGYSSSQVAFDSTGDDMDNQINKLFVYGSLYDDNYFFSTTVGYAFGEIDTSRRIIVGSLDTKAKGSTDTNQFIMQLNGSYDINQGALSFGPYAKLDIIEGEIEGYQEYNGGGFEVAFDDQDISSQLLTLGGQAQYAMSYSWGVLLPSARFEIKNEFNDSQDAINGRFVFDTTNTSFSINADDIDNLWYVFGTGLSAVFPHGLSAYVDFETTEGLNNLDLYTYSYGGRWEISF